MRGLAACLVGFLGLGALATMAACSDSTDMGSAGSAGSAGSSGGAAGGSGGKAGSSSTAGNSSTAGVGGAAECGFATDACNECLTDKCDEPVNACGADQSCLSDLLALPNCVCDPSKDPDTCVAGFVQANGDLGEKLANCYTLNCAELCQ